MRLPRSDQAFRRRELVDDVISFGPRDFRETLFDLADFVQALKSSLIGIAWRNDDNLICRNNEAQ
jgi:hypothetical protein